MRVVSAQNLNKNLFEIHRCFLGTLKRVLKNFSMFHGKLSSEKTYIQTFGKTQGNLFLNSNIQGALGYNLITNLTGNKLLIFAAFRPWSQPVTHRPFVGCESQLVVLKIPFGFQVPDEGFNSKTCALRNVFVA